MLSYRLRIPFGAGAVPGRANEAPIQAFSEADNLDMAISSIALAARKAGLLRSGE
jgi:hypothetical protein